MARETVVFNVGGRCFEVFRHIINSRPTTLLANLLDDISFVDDARPIFVDANPDRFAHVLDWYRYGQMYVDGGFASIRAVLRDASFFALPDVVTINGTEHAVVHPADHDSAAPNARKVRDATKAAILARWPTFDEYVSKLVEDMEKQFSDLRYELDDTCPTFVLKDYPVWQLSEGFPKVPERTADYKLRCFGVLVAELRRRGFECGIHDSGHGYSLRVGVQLEDKAPVETHEMTVPTRVVLDGVRVDRGLLCVHTE